MADEQHKELCERGKNWLKKSFGCQVAFAELDTISGEQPDCFGVRHGLTVLIEVKVSRSDFLADRKKPWRKEGEGMGQLRYFLAPKGLLSTDDMPLGWGLIEATNKQLKIVKGVNPKKDDLYPYTLKKLHSEFYFNDRNGFAEIYALNSIIRKVEIMIGDVQTFTKPTLKHK